MTTRDRLSLEGYTFHPGDIDDAGIFHSSTHQIDDTHFQDLMRSGIVPVEGGMMEPPRANPLALIAGAAIAGLSIWGITKLIDKYTTPPAA